MASSSSSPFNDSVHNTTFVQADPSTFREVVQKLTGAAKPISGDMGPRKTVFKLHERRQTSRKLEIKLNGNAASAALLSPSASKPHHTIMASPVSPLEYFTPARGSPTTPRSPMEEEEKAIAEKGFYLHPSPLSTPRGSDPPELLPLFPLSSP